MGVGKLRTRLARLRERAANLSLRDQPLVIVGRPCGVDGENRRPGVYYDAGGRLDCVVFDTRETLDRHVADLCPDPRWRPLVIVCDPTPIPPPTEQPT